MRVEIICVNYFSATDVRKFVSSVLCAKNSENVNILIVDNSCDEREFKHLSDISSINPEKIRVSNAGQNLGYFGASQLALDLIQKRQGEMPDYVIISNPDIVIAEDFFSQLKRVKSNSPVIGPKIISGRTGENQNPYMINRPTRLRMQLYKWIFGILPVNFVYQYLSGLKQALFSFPKLDLPVDANTDSKVSYAIHGSFIIFNRSYFTAGGNFKYGSFLFGEEIFVAETCLKLKLQIAYVPVLTVEHKEHVATGLFPKLKTLRFISDSSRYCANMYFN
ncbi:MAG: hypothetical protein A4S09_02575 [Proteobacteria bacterium SG_bin7]|nr:MAG: hypothetical protein A4S09_02575 [Proteobacteria bacterium SG_bin7]